jgi:hypothetical protein
LLLDGAKSPEEVFQDLLPFLSTWHEQLRKGKSG